MFQNINKVLKRTKQFTVLFVEDDLYFKNETAEIFERLFKHVDTAVDGEVAFTLYQTFYKQHHAFYDVVITDINMPKLNGVDMIKKMYALNPTQHIIVISAHDRSEYLLELVNVGIKQFLLKPLVFETLLAVLEKLPEKQREISSSILLQHGYSWDTQTNTMRHKDVIVPLTKNEIILMQLFIKNGNQVTAIEELKMHLLDETNNTTIQNVKPILSRFRKKTAQEIKNIYGLGYKLIF